jgi:hypothetical protein
VVGIIVGTADQLLQGAMRLVDREGNVMRLATAQKSLEVSRENDKGIQGKV